MLKNTTFWTQKVTSAYHFFMTFQKKYNFLFWDKYRTGALSSPPGATILASNFHDFFAKYSIAFLASSKPVFFHLFCATWRKQKPIYTLQAQKWIQNGIQNLTKIVPRTSWYQELYENRHGIKIKQNWTPFCSLWVPF
jgi:hypothetical protein